MKGCLTRRCTRLLQTDLLLDNIVWLCSADLCPYGFASLIVPIATALPPLPSLGLLLGSFSSLGGGVGEVMCFGGITADGEV